jgi:choline-sulfatase
MTQKNILFILTDQQRADSLGAVSGRAGTPSLDALAQEGTLFADATTTSPVCIPARFSLMSGLYPHNLGVQANRTVTYPPWLDTWVARLRAGGYRTSMFGKHHLRPEGGDVRKHTALLGRYGFDDIDEVVGPRSLRVTTTNLTSLWEEKGLWEVYRKDLTDRLEHQPYVARPSPVGEDLYYDTYVGTTAARYLRDYDRSEPWFCYVGFPGPHEPWDAPRPWADMYQSADMPRPAPMPRALAPGRAVGELDRRLEARPDVTDAEILALRANYAGSVSLIDHLVGDLLQVVRERGEWERTIVVFTSDHGEMNGDAGLFYKSVFLDGAVRVPLIVRDPDIRQVATVSAPVELMDVGATILDLAGLAEEGRFRLSRSLAGLLSDPSGPPPRDGVLSEFKGEVMLTTAEWRLALNAQGEPYLLFERSNGETDNVVGVEGYESVQRDLERQLLRRLVATSSLDPNFGAGSAQLDGRSWLRRSMARGSNRLRGLLSRS